MRVFVTGPPGIGKTSILIKVCDRLRNRGLRVGGMLTEEIRARGVRCGFKLLDLATGREGILSLADGSVGPRIGKYTVRLGDLVSVGVEAIQQAVDHADVIAIDEIGPMELCSEDFVNAVRDGLAVPKPFIATLHQRANHPLITDVRRSPSCRIVEVGLANRDEVAESILRLLAANQHPCR